MPILKSKKNETVLTVDRLLKIAAILETPANDILVINSNNIYHQNNNDNGTFICHQEVAHLYQDNKEKSKKNRKLVGRKTKRQECNDSTVTENVGKVTLVFITL